MLRHAGGALAVAIILSLGVQFAKGQNSASITVDQLAENGGGLTYHLVNTGTTSLRAPDGSVLPAFSNFAKFDSFADLGTKLFGNWTATSTIASNDSFVFNVQPFGLADVV